MGKPYSSDLRDRVVKGVAGGGTIRAVGQRYGVSASTVSKWSRRFRATGSLAPGRIGGHRPVLLAAHRDVVRAHFAEEPALTLRHLQQALAARGIVVSYGAIWAFVHAEGLSFKKSRRGDRTGPCGRRPPARPVEGASGAG
jgi:transposase